MPNPTFGKILDMGCGDGRHFPLFESIGLLGYGTEISVDMCENIIHTLEKRGIIFGDVLKGTTVMSHNDRRVKMFQFYPRVSRRESPVNCSLFGVSFLFPCRYFSLNFST